jgi:hypothetical protein
VLRTGRSTSRNCPFSSRNSTWRRLNGPVCPDGQQMPDPQQSVPTGQNREIARAATLLRHCLPRSGSGLKRRQLDPVVRRTRCARSSVNPAARTTRSRRTGGSLHRAYEGHQRSLRTRLSVQIPLNPHTKPQVNCPQSRQPCQVTRPSHSYPLGLTVGAGGIAMIVFLLGDS